MLKRLFSTLVVLVFTLTGYQFLSQSDPQPQVLSQSISPQALKNYLAEHVGSRSIGGSVYCAYDILGSDVEGNGRTEQLYLWVVCEEYLRVGQSLKAGTASSLPISVNVQQQGNHYQPISHQMPRNGGYYSQDIKRLFPATVRSQILSTDVVAVNERVQRLQREIAGEIALINGK